MIDPVLEAFPQTAQPGLHACWVLEDSDDFGAVAAEIFERGRTLGQKALAYVPKSSPLSAELQASAVITADPHHDFLQGAPLNPEAMFGLLRQESALAHSQGYDGLCVVADMDWLLPGNPTDDSIVAFELLLDEVLRELKATAVCAYRRTSFTAHTLERALDGVMSVHSHTIRGSHTPQFTMLSSGDHAWALSGEIDMAVLENFVAACNAATSRSDTRIDVTHLSFIDVAGMRALAAASESCASLTLVGVSPNLRLAWAAAGFGSCSPQLRLAD